MQQSLNALAENATYSFKRLPFWSAYKSNEENLVNFEWPTQDMLAQIAPDVTLKSIEFSTYHSRHPWISSVMCTLSNDMTSPFFEGQAG